MASIKVFCIDYRPEHYNKAPRTGNHVDPDTCIHDTHVIDANGAVGRAYKFT
jgi:hypothetical protein